MSRSPKSRSSGQGDTDAVFLPIYNYIKTLESAVLHLDIDREARKRASEFSGSEGIPLEEYATAVDDSMRCARMLQALQLADEHNKLMLSKDRELEALCAENSRICNEIMKRQKNLEDANEMIWRLKSTYGRLIAKKLPLDKKPDQENKLSPEEQRKLKTELHKLKALNNVLLQLIISSQVNWAQDSHLSALVEEASQFI